MRSKKKKQYRLEVEIIPWSTPSSPDQYEITMNKDNVVGSHWYAHNFTRAINQAIMLLEVERDGDWKKK